MKLLRLGLVLPDWAAADHCSWQAVTCAGGMVTAIELPCRGLHNDFSAVAELRDLARLDLSFNKLIGARALARLELLNLSMNNVNNTTPDPTSSGSWTGPSASAQPMKRSLKPVQRYPSRD
jgi:hypothetical protein